MRILCLLVFCSFAARAANTLYNIETTAGTSWSGDGKPAVSAVLVQPSGLALDGYGNLWISDAGDHRIRRAGPDGIIWTAAGTGTAGQRGNQLNSPYGIALDAAGTLYIADLGNRLVRRLRPDGALETIAGGGQELPGPGKRIRATDAKLSQPRDVAFDRSGNLFIADFGAHMVYLVSPDGMLSVIAGTGEPGPSAAIMPSMVARLAYPAAVAVDAVGTVYIADSGNRRVRRLSQGFLSSVTDKDGKEVDFGSPTALAFDTQGRLYVADGAARTTVVTPAGELLSLGIGGTAVTVGGAMEVYTSSDRQVLRLTGALPEVFAGARSGQGAGDGSVRAEWRFTTPSAVVRDNLGYLYIADTGNGRIRRLTPSGELSTVTTRIAAPVSLAFDSKWRLHAGDAATGAVFTVDALGQTQMVAGGESQPWKPAALSFDSQDNLLVADSANHVLRRVTPAGAMTVVAGGGPQTGDGPAMYSRLLSPSGIAVDESGSVWFTEAGSGRLRRLADGQITTLPVTELKEPRGLRLTENGFIVADRARHRVYRIAASGEWIPLAGNGEQGYSGDGGSALDATLSGPSDVALLQDGGILVVDTDNHRLRLLKPATQLAEKPAELRAPEVVHGATMRSQAVAPGQVAVVRSGPSAEDVQVSIGGARAAILDRSQDAVVVQVPAPLGEGPAEVLVSNGAKASVTVAARAPGLFTTGGGTGQAVATNESGESNSASAPAPRGSVVTLYLTGEGLQPGSVTASVGGYPSEVMWAGPTPQWPGVFQVNVRTPGGFAPSGIVSVSVTIDGVPTQAGVTIVSR